MKKIFSSKTFGLLLFLSLIGNVVMGFFLVTYTEELNKKKKEEKMYKAQVEKKKKNLDELVQETDAVLTNLKTEIQKMKSEEDKNAKKYF